MQFVTGSANPLVRHQIVDNAYNNSFFSLGHGIKIINLGGNPMLQGRCSLRTVSAKHDTVPSLPQRCRLPKLFIFINFIDQNMNQIHYILISFLIFSCGSAQKTEVVIPKDDTTIVQKIEKMIISKDTIINIGKTPVWIKSPEDEIKADILVLPGWNFAKEKICNESDFCAKALAKGYRLILPEMMKSVYATQYFPETRADYKKFLTLTWVTDTMIPVLQKDYAVFTGNNNYIHGISTGSRGAALVHLNTGKLFTKVVLLSGDFKNEDMPTDNLLKNTFGPFEQFEERWTKTDNPYEQSSKWTADLYIAHGANDDVVPTEQSIRFAEKIKKEHPDIKFISNFPDAKHDFTFWGGETDAVLKFLE